MSTSPASDYPGPVEGASGPRSTGEAVCASCGRPAQYEIESTRSGGRIALLYVCGGHFLEGTMGSLRLDPRGQIVTTMVGNAR